MSDNLYDNLLRATDNTNNITHEKYGTITKIDNHLCNVIEENSNLEHTNVPIINGLSLECGDKVILGFAENSIYNVFVIGVVGAKTIYTKKEVDDKIEEIISGEIDLDKYMTKQEYSDDLGNQTDSSQFLRALDNTIISITGRGDDF